MFKFSLVALQRVLEYASLEAISIKPFKLSFNSRLKRYQGRRSSNSIWETGVPIKEEIAYIICPRAKIITYS